MTLFLSSLFDEHSETKQTKSHFTSLTLIYEIKPTVNRQSLFFAVVRQRSGVYLFYKNNYDADDVVDADVDVEC